MLQWVAPNLVTLSGTVVMLVTCALVLYHGGLDLKGDLPGWVCVVEAIGIFLYSTLDAMDGKQARRTRTSSPLGQLFDHGIAVSVTACCECSDASRGHALTRAGGCQHGGAGCDALAVPLLLLPMATLLHLGGGWHTKLLLCTVLVPFLLAQWEEYHTHTMRTNVGGIGMPRRTPGCRSCVSCEPQR
jgi:ethanolaminephosphotransferase